jgi:quinoprotein glucose dehydrogenase
LNPDRNDYVKNLLKHAKFERFTPPSVNYDVVMYGLHGGAEWPGAAFDDRRKILVIPSNKNPWIIRVEYVDSNPGNTKIAVPQNAAYDSHCANCHGVDLGGYVEGVNTGGRHVPSLIGLGKSTKKRTLELTHNGFSYIHRYENVGVVDIETVANANSYIKKVNDFVTYSKSMVLRDSYSMLLDQHGLPASSPPWGFLTGIDLTTGLKKWQVPFGIAKNKITGKEFKGDVNFGGAMVTKAGLVVATGTRDSMARIFDVNTGAELWRDKLPAAGSAPPMGFTYKGCDYFVFVATGGKIHGLDLASDQIIAYKLKQCGK